MSKYYNVAYEKGFMSMGQAVDIVEKIMLESEKYKEYGLYFPEKVRKWETFNLLVGENGSGKSRILQMIKENAKEKCVVIYLDFASNVQLPGDMETNISDMEKTALISNLLFSDEVDKNIFLDFVRCLDNHVLSVFIELSGMGNNENELVKRKIRRIFGEFSPLIKDILHREINIKENELYLIKGDREVAASSEWKYLSPGERSILIVIFAVFVIKLVKAPCILLIDEVETHLHPDAQVKLYKFLNQTLKESVSDYCTCIASHSVFLLPLFDIQEIVYLNNGKIGNINGGLYQQVYDNLTGEGGKKEESLTDFLYSMSAWQYANYLAQCFLEPQTVDEAKSEDEQALKFVEVLKNMCSQNKMIHVLDFGAGTARIGRCIELMLKDSDEVLRLASEFKYHVYDKKYISKEFKENSAWMGRAYSTESDIISSGKKFDIILLYNVLHEIGIDEWVKELCSMLNLLTDEGVLLFGEREILSVGEKPYGKSGYLVLGKDELSKLFPESEIQEIYLPKEQKTVTLCFVIKKPKNNEGYPSEKTVLEALHALKDNTKHKIKNRDKNGLGEKGNSRKYAFYCQQYVNSEEAIEIIEEMGKNEINLQRQQQKNEDKKQWGNENTTLADIISSNLSQKEKTEKIKELAETDTEQGEMCKKYLDARKEE